MSGIQETSGSYVYQGCYNDQSNRAIPTQVSNVTSIDSCASQAQAKNATVFGVQDNGQCFVGTDLNSAMKYGANSSNCGTLGGSWTNQVYAIPTSTSNPEYTYMGCYNDQSNRAIPNFRGNVSSAAQCQTIANENQENVFGVQNGEQCFTGSNISQAYQYGPYSGSCGTLGGSWTNQVYALSQPRSDPPLILQYNFISSNVGGITLKNAVSTSNYTGTLVNNPSTNVVASNQTNVMFASFNALNQNYIQFNNFLTNYNGMTFSFFIMANSNNQSCARIFDFGNGAGSNNIVVYIDNGYLGFAVYNGSSYDLVNVVPNVINNTLIHIAWVLTYPQGWNIYVNGVLYNTQSSGWYPPAVTRNNCYLGKSNWSNDPYFTGYIGDFRIYNGLLTASEISSIYQSGIVPTLPDLLIEYNFSSSYINGTTIKNVASSSYNGTLINGTKTNVNASTSTSLMFASFNSSYYNYIQVASHATTNSGITYCYWAIVSSNNPTYTRIFDFGNGGPSNNIINSISSNNLEFSLYNNTSVYYYTADINFTNSTLYHIAWTLTYPQGWNIYVNGKLYTTISGGWYPQSITRNSCLLGRDNWEGYSFLNGSIGDFRVYNGVLNASQINSIYQASIYPPIPQLSSPNFSTEYFTSGSESNYRKFTKMIVVLLILIILIYIIFSICKK